MVEGSRTAGCLVDHATKAMLQPVAIGNGGRATESSWQLRFCRDEVEIVAFAIVAQKVAVS